MPEVIAPHHRLSVWSDITGQELVGRFTSDREYCIVSLLLSLASTLLSFRSNYCRDGFLVNLLRQIVVHAHDHSFNGFIRTMANNAASLQLPIMVRKPKRVWPGLDKEGLHLKSIAGDGK